VQRITNNWIESPRNEVFGPRNRKKFKVSLKPNNIIRFEFDSGTILPVNISVFNLAIDFLDSNTGLVRIGAVTKGVGHAGSLEYHLKTETGNGTKTAPHIADLLVLAGIAEFGYVMSPTRQIVHGVKLKKSLQ
jgi:hypothetical protein